ncbi:MAG: 6-hydroxymethylpterin diphosphokinase MptE-like protein [bacterium]
MNSENEAIWNKNLSAAAESDPAQAHTLRECDRRFRSRACTVRKCDDGLLDTQCSAEDGSARFLYHGKPAEKIRAVIEGWKIEATPGECILLAGFGLGYTVREVLQRMHRTGNLIVVEPDPILFYSAFLHVDLTAILADKRVSFIVGLDPNRAVEAIGSQYGWSRFGVLPFRLLLHPPTTDLRPGYVQIFRQKWIDALSREAMYRRSRIGSGEEVVRHTVSNLGALIREPGINRLFGEFEGVPAIQVGAGPSLSDHIDSLRRAKEAALLTCVNAAYSVLRRSGIEPHIVLCLDHNESNWQGFEGDPPHPETFLIADPRIDPRIVDLFEGRTYFISWHTTTETIGDPHPIQSVPLAKHGGNAIYQWFQQFIGEKGTVTATGSVAVAGFQVLARMGCRPIILIGQDLAFPTARVYADGTMYDDPNLPRDSEVTRSVQATDGKLVGTSETLNIYRLLLEHEIKRFDTIVVNSSLGGAMISGSIVQPIDRALDSLPPLSQKPRDMLHNERGTLENRPVIVDENRVKTEIQTACEILDKFARDSERLLDSYAESNDDVSVKQAESDLQKVIEGNRQAFDLLNEMLQEPHVRYKEARCRLLVEEDPNVANRLRVESICDVLKAFRESAKFLNKEFRKTTIE